ncbi:hypothetical protein KP509_19G006400 [Ceratopteris richardii]|uniref:F-box domain-containing protein n=1 Tax=Ceratopteris richardii TaxID=49495 RepID=A0A8T2SJH8_CERRI|nr:hypothetical protein KP509_19G006400 [Ceratopteris richardii]
MSDADLIPVLPSDIALECLLRVPLQALSGLRQVCSSWRSLLNNPSFFEARRANGCQSHLVCILQTASSLLIKSPVYHISTYNQKDKEWSILPPVPHLPRGLPLFCCCVSIGSKVVLVGGWDPSSCSVLTSVYIYDFLQGRWRRGAPMPTARSFFACAATRDGKVVVAGGHDNNKNALRSAQVYDVSADSWEDLPDMAHERDECKAICFDGEILVVSGYPTDLQGQFLGSAESFDFVERKWKQRVNFWPAGRTADSLVVVQGRPHSLQDGKLVRWEAEKAMWEVVAELPTAARIVTCMAPLADGILIVGSGGSAQSTTAMRWHAGNPSSWRQVNKEGGLGIVQHTACTVQC